MKVKHLIWWDGDCGFCRRSVQWLRARDARHVFDDNPYQSAPTPPMTPTLRAACAGAVHVVRSDGRILKAGRAVMFILEKTAHSRIEAALWRLLRQMPFIIPVEIGYAFVARNRALLSRFFFRSE